MNKNKILLIALGVLFLLAASFTAVMVGYQLFIKDAGAGSNPVVIVEPTNIPDGNLVTATPEPTATGTPAPEPTATATFQPEPTAAPTSTPLACNLVGFVMDVRVPDGSDFLPGEHFIKTWRLKNLGSCTWTTGYDLVFVGGNQMSAAQAVALKSNVAPGETVDVSISLIAPEDTGSYRGFWELRSDSGQYFGIGPGGSSAFWASIDVILPCNWVEFVKDITFPDDSLIPAGSSFDKIWRIKNIGSCTWSTDYDLVFERGDVLGASSLVLALPEKVQPGETVDLTVHLVAPDQLGSYKGYWMLRDEDGVRFGLGNGQETPFWVKVQSIATAGAFRYDFAANFCQAKWRSGDGTLNCVDNNIDADGFVRWVANPHLENRQENEPALWLHPNEDSNGWISGTYPEILIKEGDHFRTWVGCMAGYEECDVTIRLDYRIDGGDLKALGIWHEVYDGQVTVSDIDLAYPGDQMTVEVDLSSLVGKKVQFVLSVQVESHAKQAQAFWFVPRIEND